MKPKSTIENVEKTELKNLSIRITAQVCNVGGHVTAGEAERLNYLENITGKRYDAINGVWLDNGVE